ncbi:MAG: tetratricopeptide repeat protein [Planctomycetes bacterium]|nr:tetratricopeptide repeat protein [Planctomycetota bacterium]
MSRIILIIIGLLCAVITVAGCASQPASTETSKHTPAKDAQILCAEASKLYNDGKFEDALAVLDKTLELNPSYTKALVKKGAVLDDLGRHSEAIAAYKEVLKTKPKFADKLVDEGIALYKAVKYKKALQAYTNAMELGTSSPNVWHNKSITLDRLGRDDKALELCIKVLEIDQANPSAWYGASCIYSIRKDKGNALTSLSHAINLLLHYELKARSNKEFQWLWNDEDFIKTTSNLPEQERRKQEDDIRGVLLRNYMDSGVGKDAPDLIYYIRDTSNGPSRDPNDEFMLRFKDCKNHRVKKVSECICIDYTHWAVQDKTTNETGAVLTVRNIEWINKGEVNAEITQWQGTLHGLYFKFKLQLKEGKWEVGKYLEEKVS